PSSSREYHTRLRFENDGTGFPELRVRFGIRSAAGVQQLGQLAFGYNSPNERLEINSVEVRKADGSMTAVGPDAVEDARHRLFPPGQPGPSGGGLREADRTKPL